VDGFIGPTMYRLLILLIVGQYLWSVKGQQENGDDLGSPVELQWPRTLPTECRSCNPEECKPPTDCPAGIVKDGCGCCDMCGKAEYELCDHPQVPPPKSGSYYGRCGDNLECRVRSDLDETEGPEAICYCRIEGALCGSDNTTYDNMCQLMSASASKHVRISVTRKGPCNSGPVIISPPEHVQNSTGSNIAILCEAKGFPIPTVEWMFTRVDGQTVYLPSDDLHISINMRGGPEKWQVTGWLQIIDLMKEHEGDYTCIAQNEYGMAKASARINVVVKENGISKDL
jgi:hypothetical protein